MLIIQKFVVNRSGAAFTNIADPEFYIEGFQIENRDRDNLWFSDDFKHIKEELYNLITKFFREKKTDEQFMREFVTCFDIDPDSCNWDHILFNLVYYNPNAFIFV
jgi:hypothetical protein